MVSLHHVEEQLKQVGCNFQVWGRAEIRELCHVLMPDEVIAQAANGTYEGGFAMLVVTNYRVLLVDRKPMLLTLEDIRYDMIAEVDYHFGLFNDAVRLFTPMRDLVFKSWSSARLRKCVNYIQQRVMEVRQHAVGSQQLQPFMTQTDIGRNATAIQPVLQPAAPRLPMNPYTKAPLLSRRRRFPSYY